MALVRRQRAYCLSLPQRPERFARAEAALKEALEPLIELEMFPGIYGNDFRHLLPDLDALEESLGCKLYRQWPICEVEDVLRMRPDLAELPEWKIWESYISWHKCWISDRASNYIDFYNRHLKLGEVAACVGHFRLWQKAMEDDVDLCLIFEDDARLAGRDAVEQILCEFQVLEEQNFNWDLIYLHSALYSKSEEPLVQPGLSRLCLAGHRKWAGAYALSRRGLEKLTKSGYDTCMVGFAASGPNTRTQQLCLFLGAAPFLGKNSMETPLGRVCSESLSTLGKIFLPGDIPQCGGVGPDPMTLADLGNAYISKSFPKCDFITGASRAP